MGEGILEYFSIKKIEMNEVPTVCDTPKVKCVPFATSKEGAGHASALQLGTAKGKMCPLFLLKMSFCYF